MGCDIHMYPEYRRKDSKNWISFGNRINPGRNYFIFGLISKGVRSDLDQGIPTKGLPSDLAYSSSGDSRLFIVDDYNDEEGMCSLDSANSYVKYGCEIINDSNGKPTWVTHPDWHSHTWLSLEEFKKVMEIYNSESERYLAQEYEALLCALNKLDELNFDTRVICWFDN